MRIALPTQLKEWYDDFKPTDGDVVYVSAVTLFARLFGVKTYQEWVTGDIRSLMRPKKRGQVPAKILVRDLEAQGALEYFRGLDDVETVRLNQDLGIKDMNLFDDVFYVTITEEECIMAYSFFMGRMVDIHDGTEIKEMKIAPKIKANGEPTVGSKKYRPTRLVIPSFYIQQFRHFEERHGEI